MADLGTIRTAAAARLATVTGLRAHAVWPDRMNEIPCAIVMPRAWDFDLTMGRSASSATRLPLEIVILAAERDRPGVAVAQQKLDDDWLAPTGSLSIKAALEGDKTLGGTVTTLSVIGVREYGFMTVGGIDYIGAVIEWEAWP